MIVKTEALTLRVTPFSATSHVVTWLTPESGRLSTVVKGACRPKSHFLGQYDYFYTCELLYYARDRGGLHIARECTPLLCRPKLRTDWRAFAAASYACGLVSRISTQGGHHHEIYKQTTGYLDTLCTKGARKEDLFSFELRLCGALGLAPQLSRCASCGAAIVRSAAAATFAPDLGGLLCPSCTPVGVLSIPIQPDILALLSRWQSDRTDRSARATVCSRQQLLAVTRILGTFLTYHLDVAPRARQIALDLIERGREACD